VKRITRKTIRTSPSQQKTLQKRQQKEKDRKVNQHQGKEKRQKKLKIIIIF